MERKFTVKDYAELTHTSVQAVYKKVNRGTLATVKERINGKETLFILLDNETLHRDFNPETTPNQPPEVELNPDTSEELNPKSTPKAGGADEGIIAFLQEQLKEKDKQIAKLQEQAAQQAEENRKKDVVIQEQLTKMNELLRNAQQLQAQANVLLLGQGKQQEEQEQEQQGEAPPIVETEPQAAEQQAQEPKQKRSWLYRFFFGED